MLFCCKLLFENTFIVSLIVLLFSNILPKDIHSFVNMKIDFHLLSFRGQSAFHYTVKSCILLSSHVYRYTEILCSHILYLLNSF